MKGSLTLAALLVIIVGVIVVALLTMGIWFGYQTVAARYGLKPPSGPNFGNLGTPPYVLEFDGQKEITNENCTQLVNSGVVDKGKFETAEDYCNIYCPERCFEINATLYSYFYHKSQKVKIDLFAYSTFVTTKAADTQENVLKVLLESKTVNLGPWNGQLENGKSTTKRKLVFIVPKYGTSCQTQNLTFDMSNDAGFKSQKSQSFSGCPICGCMIGTIGCNNIGPCPYIVGFMCPPPFPSCDSDENSVPCCVNENGKWKWECNDTCNYNGPMKAYDSVICISGSCTTCNAYCINHNYFGGICISGSSGPSCATGGNCICYESEKCPQSGECKISCNTDEEVKLITKDCLMNGEVCCVPAGQVTVCKTNSDCAKVCTGSDMYCCLGHHCYCGSKSCPVR